LEFSVTQEFLSGRKEHWFERMLPEQPSEAFQKAWVIVHDNYAFRILHRHSEAAQVGSHTNKRSGSALS